MHKRGRVFGQYTSSSGGFGKAAELSPYCCGGMFRQRRDIQKWLSEVIEKFREKGAVSPDKAMTAEELGLPPVFEEAMKRRLGRSGIFVEANGKYYLSEERLKQIEEMLSAKGEMPNLRRKVATLRLIQLVAIVIVMVLFVVNLFVQSWELRVASVVLLVVWLLIAILQIYYITKIRKRLIL
jgi:ABC-type multidrug transport system fused ATPase/permease subunit